MKTLNILHFWAGQAGHFLQFLLSLDSKTYPILHPDTDINAVSSRKEVYSYKNITWKFNGWDKFHVSFLKMKDHVYTECLRIESFLKSANHDTYTTITTPLNFNRMNEKLQNHYIDSMDKVNHIIVELDPNLNYVIDDFKNNNHGYPIPAGYEPKQEFKEVYTNFKNTYNPYVIKLENLFYGQDTFLTEYTNLNNHLDLPMHTQDALELYTDWYNERRLGRLNIVKPE